MDTSIFDGRLARDWVLADFMPPAKKTLCMVSLGNDPVGVGYLKAVRQIAQKFGVQLSEEDFSGDWDFDQTAQALADLTSNSAQTEFVLNFSPKAKVFNQRQELMNLVPARHDADYLGSRFYNDPARSPSVVRAVLDVMVVAGAKFDRSRRVAVLGSFGFWGRRIKLSLEQTGWEDVVGLDQGELDQAVEADIVISCLGQPKLITRQQIKKDAVVIDVGYSFRNGRAWGDVDEVAVDGWVSFLTPVPGGIGPLSIAYLFKNFSQEK